jgi:hypothetical protein
MYGLVIMTTAYVGITQSAMAKKGDAGSFKVGYDHGCSDAILPVSARYIEQPGKGPQFHSGVFMDGYHAGFAACSGESIISSLCCLSSVVSILLLIKRMNAKSLNVIVVLCTIQIMHVYY